MLRLISRALLGDGSLARLSAVSGAELGSLSSLPEVLMRSSTASISTSAASLHKASSSGDHDETINVTFIDEKDNSTTTVKAPLGESLLEVTHSNDIDLEGACEGSLACSTCHVIVEGQDYYDKIPEADDDENDMLDLAFGLTDTSRLGCQVKATKDLEGLVVRIPGATRNFAVDGHVPKPH